ncbi:ribosome-associated ATPase/putative transporter RbbA [Jannaschia rubra]|uniref:Putative ABC transporter ATP-binding protein YbhF n=1 Tax=Jannaschia rubra TaxID=282197 RepID=A0A0M6XWB0_9RHOB|nr:ribosome-associated ATPase/putative transporter RbbA [Jannaschia rubra]CTQ34571.1 putative ABC transporter ATP-binding protein YbhF [Jannaschia rubra]SFG71319.1 ribosome-dependent ATPase [Jannaschia rubra]
MAAPVVQVRDVIHRYGDTLAVDGVTLDVPPGRIVGLVGPDGAGKSTLMGLVAGARRMQEGEIEVLGGSLRDARHRSAVFPRIAYMPQGLGQNLYMTLSVMENLRFFGRLFGLRDADSRARIDALLRATRLDPFADRPAGKLSGGMKQKLGLCCALIHDPDLLILDEPTTGVDPLSRRQFWTLIDAIRDSRPDMGVLVSTAYMDEAGRFDTLHAMWHGRVLGRGSAEELRKRTGEETLERAFTALLPDGARDDRPPLTMPPRPDHGGETAIAARDLTRRFGDFTAVDTVSFDIPRGEIYGFIGSNGSGKTTTMKMLTGLMPATEGDVSLFGQPVDATDIGGRARVGYMSQAFSLYGDMTVRENLALHARLFRLDARQTRDRIADLLDRFDLSDHADAGAGDLPLGLRQRLSLAVAVIHRPEVLILDEPTSGVDPMARDAFWRILAGLSRDDGVTIFVSTHFMSEAALCDRMALMHAGKVLDEGPPAEIAARHGDGDLEAAFIALIEQADGGGAEAAARAARGIEMGPAGQDTRSGASAALTRALAYAGRETVEILRDPIRLVFAFGGTVILMLIFAFGISMDVEDMKFAVLDQDRSPESRAYLQTFEASPYFLPMPPVADTDALVRRLRAGDTTMVLDIPPDFGRAIRQGRPVEAQAWIDGANTQRAGIVEGYVRGGHQSYLAEGARPGAGGVDVQTRWRYNPTVDSIYAIAPSVPAMLLMMFPAILMAISVAREREIGTITNFHVTPTRRVEFMGGKQLPYLGIGLVNFALMTAMAVFLFGVPLTGSLSVLTLAAVLYLLASTGFGLLVSVFTTTQVAAVFATMVISMMPTVIFSGMMQPVETLEGGARLIGSAWPTRYYMQTSVGAFTKGLGWDGLAHNLLWIAVFIPVFIAPALLLLKKQEA